MHLALKIARLSVLLLAVFLTGTLGYRYFLGWSWVDALYMTAITTSTVGFGEVKELTTSGRLWTIALMLTSIGVFAYALTTLASTVLEARFGSVLWRHRMETKIKNLTDHYIICGFGRTGRSVCEQLTRSPRSFVVIESSPEKLEKLQDKGVLFVEGDATSDESLYEARIDHAAGLVAALGNDAENVYLVLSARQINPDLSIVSWATSEEAEGKVLRAGANHSLSPYLQGGRRIANLLTAPHALEFLDNVMGGSENIRLCEIEVKGASALKENSIIGAGIGRNVGVIVIGIRRASGKMEFNPSAEEIFHEGDILIGMGSPEQIEILKKMI